jgi:hypothetical protein
VGRALLVTALLAFLLPALAGPLESVCVCLTEGTAVAVGSCCCDRAPAPAEDPCGPGCPAPHDEDCSCVDLVAADVPAAPERRADPVPAPAASLLPVCVAALPGQAMWAPAADPERPPPRVGASPRAPRVLRV